MKFIRKTATSFFLPQTEIAGNNIFVFADASFSEDEFDIEKAFSVYTSKFLVVFYKGSIDFSADQFLKNKLSFKSIVWLHSFAEQDIVASPTMQIGDLNEVISLSNFSFDTMVDDYKVFLDINDSESVISFSPERNALILSNTNGNFAFFANRKYSYLSEIQIPLINSIHPIGNFSSSVNDNFSSLRFQTIRYKDRSIQPYSHYISSKDAGDGAGEQPSILEVEYFEDASFRDNIDLFLTFFPYKDLNNNTDTPSYFELIPKNNNQVKWNGINNSGKHFTINDFTQFKGRLALLEFDNNPRFSFIPADDSKLTLLNNGNHPSQFLLGFSGTESINLDGDSLAITFKTTGNLKVNSDQSDLEESMSSITSHITFDPKTYNLDAEKAPLFSNEAAADSMEKGYSPVRIGTIPATAPANPGIGASPVVPIPAAFPIIPTLSFKDNPDLVELEKVFTKMRLRHAPNGATPSPLLAEAPKSYVTPQGFLRSGNTIDFINPDSASTVNFRVSDVTLTSDFNLSLSKEDVFFVLKPSMLQSALEKISVEFKLSDFKIVLEEFNKIAGGGTVVKDDTYIIFKFSRHSFQELLNDPTKWSNYNKYKPTDPSALIAAINSKLQFPTTDDYKYFNETIKTDANWNGVLIVNIPIGNSDNLPDIFKGLTGSQDLKANPEPIQTPHNRLQLKTGLRFQYVAFPVNKTKIKDGAINIGSTSFYGIIDYDLLNNPDQSKSPDYQTVSDYFTIQPGNAPKYNYKFILTKLLVRFENSQIRNFKSYAFLQVPELFDNNVEFDKIHLSHPGMPDGDLKEKLVRLEGSYQKNSNGNDEFNFTAQAGLQINFSEGCILKNISVSKLSFNYSPGTKESRFDIDAKAGLNSWSLSDIFSIESLDFQNIGLKFNTDELKLPNFNFDLSRFLVLPKINFDGNGFLSSFPIKFNCFQNFHFPKIAIPGGFKLGDPDFDFFKLKIVPPNVDSDWLKDEFNKFANLFCFIFDFDLGTLGNLGALKSLKGQMLVGWSFKGGFALGFKLAGPSSDGLHLDLFGAVKLDIASVDFKKFTPEGSSTCSAYFLRLVDARLTIFGKALPPEDRTFNGIIFAQPGAKVAWLINYDNNETDKLILGLGQRVGPKTDEDTTTTVAAIEGIRSIFKDKLKDVELCQPQPISLPYKPNRDWLIASETILPEDWPIELKFIFNDPVLYGLYLGFKGDFLKGFSIDILYKKISETLGVYSLEIQLPDELRNHDTGGAFFKLPNIGIDIYTNGDWKVDIGFPKNGNDWSRSGFLQLRTAPPFVGWFGFYMMQSKIASLTLFNGYIKDEYSQSKLNIIQAGFALRVGIGAYLDEGILYVGASITVYGIMEGAFAFEKGQSGLSKLFPDHFAVRGRMGALAELIGYVDFGIIKASVYISLRAEFGLLLVYLSKDGIPGSNSGKGIQPVKIYIEGEVRVEISIKIGCIKIHLSFRAFVRFEYTIGGGKSSSAFALFEGQPLFALAASAPEEAAVPVQIAGITDIPMIYLPAFSKVNENSGEKLLLIHSFMIPFFGKEKTGGKIAFTDSNILKDKIIKPFLKDLITWLSANSFDTDYETIRAILLNGKSKDKSGTIRKINIQVPNYRPTFINGINSGDISIIDPILSNPDYGFGFNPGDTADSILKAYEEAILVIPAPISKKIKVVGPGGAVTNIDDGFVVRIEQLVNDDAGNSLIESRIDAVKTFDDATLDWIEKFYDDYKTQFIERSKEQNMMALAPEDNKDLRDEIIIPEFFKLVTLLTMEAFYQSTNANHKNKHEKRFNPVISINDNGSINYGESSPWNPNDALEQIVGQLNYFYNSGLRLPEINGDTNTKSIYEILQQSSVIAPLPGPRDAENVSISLGGHDITDDVFADVTDVERMWEFIDGFDAVSPNILRQEFDPVAPIRFTRPFDLIPVTLAVQNTKLNVHDSAGNITGRFFTIPEKLALHAQNNTRYAFEINYANYDLQNNGKDVIEFATNKPGVPLLNGFEKCLNVEIKVKKHSDRVLEMINVFVNDLNLIDAIHRDDYVIDTISFYYKNETIQADSDKDTSLTPITNEFATILKTNLSPRTSPPFFDTTNLGLAAAATINEREYWDDSNNPDKKNFIRLLWEALTTNNGGYDLVLDRDVKFSNDASGNEAREGTIIVAFAGKQDKIPCYFNALNFTGDNAILQGLDDKETNHYLYIDAIRMTDDKVSDKAVLEYHSTIPAHTAGFELLRDRTVNTSSNYFGYLPLEFNLQETGATEPVLSNNKVLPIMPTSVLDEAQNPVTGKYRYNHITPLLTRDAKTDPLCKNLDRYSCIGKQYKLSVNLRDTFGFRINEKNKYLADASYTHYYADKIVPVEAWPLIKFSWWLDKFEDGHLYVNLVGNCNIKAVLDLAGISKDLIDPQNPGLGYKYRYDFGDEINKANEPGGTPDIDRLKEVIPGILNQLYTILAQLKDAKTSVSVNKLDASVQKGKWIDKITEITDKLVSIITLQDGKYKMPDEVFAVDPFSIEIETTEPLKNELNVAITLQRTSALLHTADENLFTNGEAGISLKELIENYIWDYAATSKSSTTISPINPDPAMTNNSGLVDLNNALRSKTGNEWALGISSEVKVDSQTKTRASGKVIYLINEGRLSQIKAANVNGKEFDEKKCYFGIKPFSNKLWSGDYNYEGTAYSFSNIDLDKSLRIVLAQIDELLEANKLPATIYGPAPDAENIKKLYNSLIAAKKSIVHSKLKDKIDWVMDDVNKPAPGPGLTAEFGDLILSGLKNFYEYDGIVKTTVTGNEVLGGNHRLSIYLKPDKEAGTSSQYNLVSSKIGDKGNEWYILFDQKEEVKGKINFDIQPEITHIEFNVEEVPDSEIQYSTWIQLLTPIKLLDEKYHVKDWVKITRQFPDKPVILSHNALQSKQDDGIEPVKWDIQEAGKWNYELVIKDNNNYITGDQLKVELWAVGAAPVGFANGLIQSFESFIAYWAAQIQLSSFDWIKFVQDLKNQFSGAALFAAENSAAETSLGYFILEKKSDTEWALSPDTELPDSLKNKRINPEFSAGVLKISVGDFNIFDKAEIIKSITASVNISRNKQVKNDQFIYETENVRPVSPASPHIKYFTPFVLNTGSFETMIFQPMPSLPFKATAKYLVNTDSAFPSAGHYTLPVIPVQQIECNKNKKPSETDGLFEDFDNQNGYAAFSLTVYNDEVSAESDLPIFYADTIVKINNA